MPMLGEGLEALRLFAVEPILVGALLAGARLPGVGVVKRRPYAEMPYGTS
jgi:hypothetical protein